jgi:hypothetical protein
MLGWKGNLSWWVTLIAYALRLNLWVVMPILLFPKEKVFWLLLAMCFLNLPTILSDMKFIDKYDGLWIYLRIVCAIAMLLLMMKRLYELKKQVESE